MSAQPENPILLYDGVCGLCNRLVKFILKHDKRCRLRFASLQSEFAANLLQRHGVNVRDFNSVYLVEACPQERLAARSDAVVSVLRQIGGPWSIAAALLRIVPRSIRDLAYNLIARNRYRIFGRSESCLLPEAKYRDRFIDI